MKIKCRKCQNFFDETNEEEDVFCPYCGALIHSADQIVSESCYDVPSLVYFRDLLENESVPHFGLRLPDQNILCLECGGTLEPEDYEILHDYHEIGVIDQVLQKHMWIPKKEKQ